jgi:hypothetical protein
VVKRHTLNKEKIHAERHLAVVLEYWGRDRYCFESRNVRSRCTLRRLSFQDCDVGSVYDEGALCVVWRDRAVPDEIPS